MLRHMSLTTICRSLLTVFVLLVVFFVLLHPPSTWQLNSSLRGLSPDFIKDKDVQGALSTLSNSMEKKFFLILIGDNADSLEEAFELFRGQVNDDTPFAIATPFENLDGYLKLILDHRFHLMTQAQSLWLEHATTAELQAYTQARLYGLEGSAQALSFADDPFGFASNFVLTAADQRWSQGEANRFTLNATTHYFLPIALEVNGDALGMAIQENVLSHLSQIKSDINRSYPKITFLHSGILFFAADAAQKSNQDVSLIVAGSSIGVVLLLLIVFRSINALILPISSVAFGVLLAFIITHFIYGSVHILTIVFGASLIGVAIDYALHFLYHQSHDSKHKQKEELHRALVFSLATSVIGYGALAMSGLDSLRHVAIFSVLGLVGAWLVVLAVGPGLTKARDKTHNKAPNRKASPLKNGVAKILALSSKVSLRTFCLSCTTVIAVFAYFSLNYFTSNDDPRVFFNPNSELLAEEKRVSDLISSYEPGNFIIVKGRSNAQVLERLEKIETNMGADAFSQLFGMHRFVPSLKQQEKIYAQNTALYSQTGNGSAVLEKLGMSKATLGALKEALALQDKHYLLPDAVLSTLGESASSLWLTRDSFHYSLTLIPRGFSISNLASLGDQIEGVFFINSAKLAGQAITQQRKSASLLAILALGLVAVLILFRHRQIQYLTLVLVPATAMALTLLLLHACSIAITLFHIMALFLVLGLGMDYVIFVSEINDNKTRTLEAVVLSALTSLLSFGLLSFSSIPVVHAFGLTVFIGNTLNLAGTFCIAHYFNTRTSLSPYDDAASPIST